MRTQAILLVSMMCPISALAQEADEVVEDAKVTSTAVDAEAAEPETGVDEKDDGPPTIVINGDATLMVNGDIILGSATGDGAVTVKQQPVADDADEPSIGRPIKILEIFPGEVRIDAGSNDGVSAGQRFAVFRHQVVETESGDEFEGETLVAVIEVIAVSSDSAIAELWKGDRVQMGDDVRPALANHKSSKVFPRRLPHVGEIALVLRPLMAVGSTGGFGGLADVTAAYWWKHMFFDIRMQPLGFGWTEDGNIVSASFMAEGGYDGRAFAIGLGAGVSTVNGDIDEMMQSFVGTEMASHDGDGAPDVVKWDQRTRAAFTISQQVRLGARDGLNVSVYNLLMYHNDDDDNGEDNSGFIYAGTTGKITVPLAARTFIFLEGGGGVMGYGFGDLGVFTWVRGNGDAGSIGISALAGGAVVWGVREKTTTPAVGEPYSVTETVLISGPMVGLGMTYRFGF